MCIIASFLFFSFPTPSGLYIEGKTSGNNPAQNSRRNVNHWIYVPSLEMRDKTLHGAINDALQVSKRQ